MQKFYPLVLILLLAASTTSAQTAPEATVLVVPRTEEYCTLIAFQSMANSGFGFEISIDYGMKPKPLPDNQYESASRFPKFYYVADALNYQNSRGWELVSFTSSPLGSVQSQYYVMKRRLKP